jgi:hypothetical protein
MASGNNIEPEIGREYRYGYVGGRVYDPDYYEQNGVFLLKLKTPPTPEGNTEDVYVFSQKLPGFGARPQMYLLTYVFKKDIKADRGVGVADPGFDDLLTAVKSRSFPHPTLNFTRLYPTVYIDVNQIAELLRLERARSKIGNFMTQAIYHPPIQKTNATGTETTVFTGGPMFKRGMAAFTANKKRKSRKQRGGLGQPLSYTDPTYREPSADAGFNRQGIEPPYIVRPALAAIPMRGGAEQMLSPMAFKDAYHSAPLAPTGQPLADIKFPATLRQGLNFGRLSGGGKRNTRRNTRRGGFYPSIMGGVVANAPLLAPLAARQGIHLFEEYKRTTRKRKSTRKSHRRRNSGRRA